jgi:acetoin:2,6-dichlorophenolindophenol oxidoreductase subunit alpha
MKKSDIYKAIYYRMLLTRFLEEALVTESQAGNTFGPLHLCIGQEASGVAACAALKQDDVISTTHRGHAHYIGKGLDLKRLCCEIFGKDEGYGRGRAGHMIIFDRKTGVLGGSGIVGGGIPVATGQALAFMLKNEDRIVMSCFGDGATNTGAFHEALNMAAKWQLPILFFCENNKYGLTVHVDEHLSCKSVAERATAYNIPGKKVEGNDLVKVHKIVLEAVKHVRSGKGPVLIEAETYRMTGFSTGDAGGYQRSEEQTFWQQYDPIDLAETALVQKKILTRKKIVAQRKSARKEIDTAINYAKSAKNPDPIRVPEDIYEGAES